MMKGFLPMLHLWSNLEFGGNIFHGFEIKLEI